MSKVAILFPGQGSQFNNMGSDFYTSFEQYKQIVDQTYNLLPDVKAAVEGELDINDTRYAQPALFSNQVGILEVIKSKFDLSEVVYGGFSLGEYSAYYGTGKFDFATGLQIISKRAQEMSSVETSYQTKIVLGLTKDALVNLVNEINQTTNFEVIISNYNLEKQLLINFDQSDSEYVVESLKAAGAKRVLDIAISGPFHTKLYAQAAANVQAFISDFDLKSDNHNLYLNLTGRKYEGEELALIMHDHMLMGVQWQTEIESMIADGVDTFVELGSKSVVSNMVKKINRKANIITIEKVEDLEKLEELWNKK